jgi:hypothetical protein
MVIKEIEITINRSGPILSRILSGSQREYRGERWMASGIVWGKFADIAGLTDFRFF